MNSQKIEEELIKVKQFYKKVGSLDPLIMTITQEDVEMVVKYLKLMKVAPHDLQVLFRYAYIDGYMDWDLENICMKPEKEIEKLHSRLRGYLIKALKCKGGD